MKLLENDKGRNRLVELDEGEEVLNAKITSTELKLDNGFLTFWLTVEGEAWGCGIGGYTLSQYEKQRPKGSLYGIDVIMKILSVVGVEKWEDLKGKYLRVISRGLSEKITTIGNIIRDDWVDFTQFKKDENGEVIGG